MMLLTACGQDKENSQEAVYVNITAEEEQKMFDIIRSRGLYLNNYTYKEAYKYAVNKGIVKPTKITR